MGRNLLVRDTYVVMYIQCAYKFNIIAVYFNALAKHFITVVQAILNQNSYCEAGT